MTIFTNSGDAVTNWLRKRRSQVVYLSALLVAEVVLGLVVHHVFGKFNHWWDVVGYIVCCAAVLHYVHLLVEHYRPRHSGVRASFKRMEAMSDEEVGSTNWTEFQMILDVLIRERGEFPPGVITEWRRALETLGGDRLAHSERLLKWLRVPKLFIRNKISLKFLDHITVLLTGLKVPKQVEGIFGTTLAKEIDRMNELATEQPTLKLDRDRQYTYASGIAEYYAEQARELGSIYATALDTPSTFFRDFAKYFSSQVPLRLAANDGFVKYAGAEVANLKALLAQFKGDTTALPRMQGNDPVEKARIVVITRATLLAELTNDDFWHFVRWHTENHVGLRFFARDGASHNFAVDWYEKELQRRTGQPAHETIDDFIVYGKECVFGRIDPAPDEEGRVTLGFYYVNEIRQPPSRSQIVVPKYKEFFEVLWQDQRAYTLTELWYAADFSQRLRTVSDRLAALLELYRDTLTLRPEKQEGNVPDVRSS